MNSNDKVWVSGWGCFIIGNSYSASGDALSATVFLLVAGVMFVLGSMG